MHKAQIANIMSANKPLIVNPSLQSVLRRNDNQQIVCSNQSLNKYIIESGMPI